MYLGLDDLLCQYNVPGLLTACQAFLVPHGLVCVGVDPVGVVEYHVVLESVLLTFFLRH
jgi:hypothetical protein